MTRTPTPQQAAAYRAKTEQAATERAERARAERERAARTAPVGPAQERARMAQMHRDSGWEPLGRRRQSAQPDYDIDSPQPKGPPPMAREQSPQKDIFREAFDHDALDADIEKAGTHANELLDALGAVLSREAALKTAERQQANDLARTLPAIGRNE